jgi:hypothetical protein
MESRATAARIARKRVQQMWNPVLRPDARPNKDIEQDDDSKIRHPARGIIMSMIAGSHSMNTR